MIKELIYWHHGSRIKIRKVKIGGGPKTSFMKTKPVSTYYVATIHGIKNRFLTQARAKTWANQQAILHLGTS